MDDEEEKNIRWKLLIDLIEKAGGNVCFVEKYQRTDLKEGEEISVTFLSQLKNRTRPFGAKAARKIERLSILPAFYFDPWRKESSINPEISKFLSRKNMLKLKPKEIIDSMDDEEKLIQASGFLGYIDKHSGQKTEESEKKTANDNGNGNGNGK